MQNVIRRELRVAFSKKAQPPLFRVIKWIVFIASHCRDSPNEILSALDCRPASSRHYDPFNLSLEDAWLDSAMGRAGATLKRATSAAGSDDGKSAKGPQTSHAEPSVLRPIYTIHQTTIEPMKTELPTPIAAFFQAHNTGKTDDFRGALC